MSIFDHEGDLMKLGFIVAFGAIIVIVAVFVVVFIINLIPRRDTSKEPAPQYLENFPWIFEQHVDAYGLTVEELTGLWEEALALTPRIRIIDALCMVTLERGNIATGQHDERSVKVRDALFALLAEGLIPMDRKSVGRSREKLINRLQNANPKNLIEFGNRRLSQMRSDSSL